MHEWTHNLLKHNRTKDHIDKHLHIHKDIWTILEVIWSHLLLVFLFIPIHQDPHSFISVIMINLIRSRFSTRQLGIHIWIQVHLQMALPTMWFTWLDELTNNNTLFVSFLLLPSFEKSSSYIRDPLWQPTMHWAIFFSNIKC